jgi:hypothetical protein
MWQQHGDDAGIWTEYRNDQTGQSSLETHTPRVVWKACATHVFDTFVPPSRKITCLVCGQEVRFIVGKHRLNDLGELEAIS